VHVTPLRETLSMFNLIAFYPSTLGGIAWKMPAVAVHALSVSGVQLSADAKSYGVGVSR